jgi:hypothetical protein
MASRARVPPLPRLGLELTLSVKCDDEHPTPERTATGISNARRSSGIRGTRASPRIAVQPPSRHVRRRMTQPRGVGDTCKQVVQIQLTRHAM